MKDVNEVLLERLHSNQDAFLSEVKHYDDINKIINSSYEIVMKEDMICLFECNDELLTDKQCTALLKFKNPLEVLYDAWQESDCSHMNMLRDTITERAEEVVKEMAARSKSAER